MKKIIAILTLLLSVTSFGWKITSKQVEMSETEAKQFFGNDVYCGLLGYNYLSLSLISEGKFKESNVSEMAISVANQMNAIGGNLKKQNPKVNMSENEFVAYYYAYKCKIPSNSQMQRWGSPTFIKTMEGLRKSKNILKTKYNDVQL